MVNDFRLIQIERSGGASFHEQQAMVREIRDLRARKDVGDLRRTITLDGVIGRLHVVHARACSCLNDSARCCYRDCPCHAESTSVPQAE